MAVPVLPIALGAGVIALLLLSRNASASSGPGPSPGPTPGPLPPTPPPSPFPPGSALATVIPNAQNGINTRSGPSPNDPLIPENTAFNGTTVAVLRTGIPETGAPAGSILEWWEIITPTGGRGFARAVGPQGERNFQATGNVPLPGRPQNVMLSNVDFAREMRRRQVANDLRQRMPIAGYGR